jgi:hypothetical protein
MKRMYTQGEHSDTVFFVGREVEHTPAHGEKTLFVVGVHVLDAHIEDILLRAKINNCTHIYCGANQSFVPSSHWEHMVTQLLKQFSGMVTLDFDHAHCAWVIESGFCEYQNFIPQLSIKLPYAQLLGYNATIKIDDAGFNASNPGVWCHQLHNLMDRAQFTAWQEYSKDEILPP